MIPITEAAKSLGVAFAIGILVGVERERRKGEGAGRAAAGVRTFTLVSLAGAIARLTDQPILLAVSGLLVVGGALLSYLRTSKLDPGLTTEVALGVTFLLGTLTVDRPALAAALGVSVAVILASRSELHRFVREVLTAQELEDLLIFAAAAVVVLPLTPNRAMGPYGLINPFTTWRLVVIMMAINGAGYIVLRGFGSKYGLAVAGFFSGFVSSSATIASMGSRSKSEPSVTGAAISGAVLSSVATVAQMFLVVGATSPMTLGAMAIPMLAAGAVAVLLGALSSLRAMKHETRGEAGNGVGARRAFDLKAAVLLAATVSFIMALSSLLLRWFGDGGLLVAVSLAGFADTHSAAISAATLVQSGAISSKEAVVPILCAFTTNSVTKCVLALTAGTRQYARFVLAAVVLMAIAAWSAFVLAGSFMIH
jgi:uncharacterized membrane protein (DUF4010 family)